MSPGRVTASASDGVIMASTPNDDHGISRREFATRVGAAAGIAIGGKLLDAPLRAAARAAGGRIIGANDRVVTASIGIRGQGNALKRGFAQAQERRDQDAVRHRREPGAGADQRRAPERRRDVQAGLRPGPPPRPRRQGHRRDRHRRRRTTGTRSPPSGGCRPASTSTSRSRRRTPCGKAARWSRRRRATTRSCRSAR